MYVFHHYYPKNPRSVNVVAFLAQGEFEVNIHRKLLGLARNDFYGNGREIRICVNEMY